ncbi:hypothetical protein BaRGS_00020151, partial [Batillaria attramentaria]
AFGGEVVLINPTCGHGNEFKDIADNRPVCNVEWVGIFRGQTASREQPSSHLPTLPNRFATLTQSGHDKAANAIIPTGWTLDDHGHCIRLHGYQTPGRRLSLSGTVSGQKLWGLCAGPRKKAGQRNRGTSLCGNGLTGDVPAARGRQLRVTRCTCCVQRAIG